MSATSAAEPVSRKDFIPGTVLELLFMFHFVYPFHIGYKSIMTCVSLAWYILQKWFLFLQKLTSVSSAWCGGLKYLVWLQRMPPFGKLKLSLPWACIICSWWHWIVVRPTWKNLQVYSVSENLVFYIFLGTQMGLEIYVSPDSRTKLTVSYVCIWFAFCFLLASYLLTGK